MSAEQLPKPSNGQSSYTEYAEQLWYGELIRMQNNDDWSDSPVFISCSFQDRYAETLIKTLREKPYFQKFGGKTLEIIMVQTSEPYMYNVGIRVID